MILNSCSNNLQTVLGMLTLMAPMSLMVLLVYSLMSIATRCSSSFVAVVATKILAQRLQHPQMKRHTRKLSATTT